MSRDISDRRSDVEYLSDQPVSLQMAAVSVRLRKIIVTKKMFFFTK